MTQVEALRLAMQKVPLEKLKPVDVLNNGFYQIKNFDTGGISSTPLTYGPGKIEGVDQGAHRPVAEGEGGEGGRLSLPPHVQTIAADY